MRSSDRVFETSGPLVLYGIPATRETRRWPHSRLRRLGLPWRGLLVPLLSAQGHHKPKLRAADCRAGPCMSSRISRRPMLQTNPASDCSNSIAQEISRQFKTTRLIVFPAFKLYQRQHPSGDLELSTQHFCCPCFWEPLLLASDTPDNDPILR